MNINMNDSFENFRVNSKDIECPICYETYSAGKHQPMGLSCGHSICYTCSLRIKSICPYCKIPLRNRPAKNRLASSFIENHSKTKKCTIHGKPKEYFCREEKKWLCSDCIILERLPEKYQPRHQIDFKIQEIKEQVSVIPKKKAQLQAKIPQLLNKRGRNWEEAVETAFQEKLENLFWYKKKMKSIIQICNFTDKERYEHQILTDDISKSEQKTQGLLEKWKDNQEEEGLVSQIFQAPEEIKCEIESFCEKENKILQNIHQEEKEFSRLFFESMANFDLKKLQDKLQDSNRKLDPKYLPEISQNFLLETFQNYGIQYQLKENHEIFLQESFSYLNKFNPKHFKRSVEKLNLVCAANLSDNKFNILCDILLNVQDLAELSVSIEAFSMKKAELLANLVLNSKSLQKFSFKAPLNPKAIDYFTPSEEKVSEFFEELVQRILPVKLSNISIDSFDDNILLDIQLDPFQTALSLEKFHLGLALNSKYSQIFKSPNFPQKIAHAIFALNSIQKYNIVLAGEEDTEEKIIGPLFALPQQDLAACQNLEEIKITVRSSYKVDLQKIRNYLNSFSNLKRLVIVLDKVDISCTIVEGFLKEMLNMKAPLSFKFVCEVTKDLSDRQTNLIESLTQKLSRFEIKSKIIINGQVFGASQEGVDNEFDIENEEDIREEYRKIKKCAKEFRHMFL